MTGYNNSSRIIIDHTKVGGDLTNYPLYIDLSNFNDNFWLNVQDGGGDIRITTSDGITECPREIVSCDTTLKTGEVHTLIPSVSSSVDTVVYIYYGNPLATDYLPTDTYGSQAVWGSTNVYHCNDLTPTKIKDSSGQYDGFKSASNPPAEVNGKVYKGQSFDGVSNIGMINADVASVDVSQPHAFVAWVKMNTAPNINNNGIIDKWQSGTGVYSNGIRLTISPSRYLQLSNGYSNSGSLSQELHSNSPLALDTYYFVAGVYDGTNLRIHINNTNKSIVKIATPINGAGISLRLGNTHHSNGTLDGTIDEVRIYKYAPTVERLDTEYNNQNEPATFYSVINQQSIIGISSITGINTITF